MHHVLVLGSPGSGKSTLSLAISKKINVPVIHLDQHFWQAGWVETEADDWRDKVLELSQRSSWIMDGNYRATMDLRLSKADTVIFLDTPRVICLWRVTVRFLLTTFRIDRTRADMAVNCPERLDTGFLEYIWKFSRAHGGRLMKSLSHFEGTMITLKTKKDVATYIKNLRP